MILLWRLAMHRYDIVIYGASGFTGAQIVKTVATAEICKGKTVAVAGRNESKVRATLDEVAKDIGPNGYDVRKYPIIVADSSEPKSLNEMAKQAKVIINAVGPYRQYGEHVVRAAVENGASHLDISGEEQYMESMELLYTEKARETGSYVISACGWDSIPVDMAVEYLKQNFPGELGYVETCCQFIGGEKGFVANTGTYDSIVLIMSEMFRGDGGIKNEIMPTKIPKRKYRPCKGKPIWRVRKAGLNGWALPFISCDKPIVNRSQYYDYTVNNQMPIPIETYFCIPSLLYTLLIPIWISTIFIFAQFGWTRRFLLRHPERCSFGMFNRNGPTKEQREGSLFENYAFGKGWKVRADGEHDTPPDTEAYVVVRGRDPAYEATATFIVSCAVALIDDREKLPPRGGVFTTATAFRHTRLIENIRSLGITFELVTGQDATLTHL